MRAFARYSGSFAAIEKATGSRDRVADESFFAMLASKL